MTDRWLMVAALVLAWLGVVTLIAANALIVWALMR